MILMEYKHPIIRRKPRPLINNFISFIFKKEWVINEGFEHINHSHKEIKEGEIIISD